MNYVTIKESHYQNDLVVLKSRLESEGIECRLKNELTTQVINYMPAFTVELQVPENKVDQARNIMIETGETDSPGKLIVCPKCGSRDIGLKMNIATRIQLFLKMIGSALTMKTPDVGNVLKNSSYKCKNCGEEFE
ncbi:MAG: putative signal transducing protein [Tangfeifania sp.]